MPRHPLPLQHQRPTEILSKKLYAGRSRIEITVGKAKRFKRIALRCEKTAINFASFFEVIVDRSHALKHEPMIIDRKFRADREAKERWGQEVERLKFFHMPDFDDVMYDFRKMAERVNARLRDAFGAKIVRVRGAIKVKGHVMFGILALAVDQIIRVVDIRPAPA